MKVTTLLIVTLLSSFAVAGPLDEPATKSAPTVRSEIKRGYDAATLALDKTEGLLAISNAFKALVNENRSRNTDTDALLLGAYYEYWKEVSIYISAFKESLLPAEKEYGRTLVESSYKTFREKQKALGLDDRAFAEALGIEPEFLPGFLETLAHPFTIAQ